MHNDLLNSLVEKGLPVFALKPNGKTPAHEDWQKEATTKPVLAAKIAPSANVGVATGNGLFVLDVDMKKGKDGEASLGLLQMMFDNLPETYTVQTATGGKHLYFRSQEDIRNGVNTLGDGLDIRGKGGYVVAPGSSTPDGEYTVAVDAPIAEAPEWLIAEIKSRAKHRNAEQAAVTELDQPFNISRAIDYLERTAPAIEGNGGDNASYQTAAMVKDFGISRSLCQALMEEHFNPRCSPPWEPEALAVKVNSAYANGQNAPGSKGVDASWAEPVPQEDLFAAKTKEIKPPTLFPFIRYSEVQVEKGAIALVKDLIDQETMSVLYGQSNAGKTFVAASIAFSVATGREWAGKRVEQGAVVYIAAEGARSMMNRIAALRQKHKVVECPFYVIPCQVNLLKPEADVKNLIATIRQIEAEDGVKVKLVIVDTLARAIAGGNENASEDMGAFVGNCDTIRLALHAHMMIVHHSGKDAAKGARGHSSLRAATDTELEVEGNTVKATKQRDMESGEPIGFELETVTLGQNVYDEPITSCTLRFLDPGERKDRDMGDKALNPRQAFVLMAFSLALNKAHAEGLNYVTEDAWRAQVKITDASSLNEKERMPEKSSTRWSEAFRNARDALAKAGHVMNVQGKQWVIAK